MFFSTDSNRVLTACPRFGLADCLGTIVIGRYGPCLRRFHKGYYYPWCSVCPSSKKGSSEMTISLLYQKRIVRCEEEQAPSYHYDERKQINIVSDSEGGLPAADDPIVLGTSSKSRQRPSDDDPDAYGGALY